MSNIRLPTVIEIDGPPRDKMQCELPESELVPEAFKGYRERRARQNGQDVHRCMRHARWIVGNERLCTQHAGLKILNIVKSGNQGDLL